MVKIGCWISPSCARPEYETDANQRGPIAISEMPIVVIRMTPEKRILRRFYVASLASAQQRRIKWRQPDRVERS
jgi:hypothetical protein